jgi:hypothetical protein
MPTSACSSRSLRNPKIASQTQIPILSQPNRLKYRRKPASFLVNCYQADLTKVGGKALNWSPEGDLTPLNRSRLYERILRANLER